MRAHRAITENPDSVKAHYARRYLKEQIMKMSMVLAHEIAHMFHTFLAIMLGVEEPLEPLNVTYGGQHEDKPHSGEIGFAFEYHAWGGKVRSDSPDEGYNWEYFTAILPIIAKIDKDAKLKIGAKEGKSYVIPFEMAEQFIEDPSSELFPPATKESC